MINAIFSKSLSGRLRLKITGHASADEEGGELVCAAASSVFYALSGYLYNFCREGLRVYALESGNADIECGSDGEEAMKFTLLGLWQIYMGYPEHIRIENRAFGWKMVECVDASV